MSNAKDLNAWLSYSISPHELKTALREAAWGNGQLELLARLDRPSVNNLVCFGFGARGLWYGNQEHLIPAVYDAATRKKYLLIPHPGWGADEAEVVFRPDRQIWRYEYDDLRVDVALILPRLFNGYLMKVELMPKRAWANCSSPPMPWKGRPKYGGMTI